MAKLTVKNGIVTKYSGDVMELVIPEGVTEIGDPEERWKPGIFEGHEELTSVILPESLLRIGDKAFKGCSGLTDIRIPDNVTSIGGAAFFGCKGLKNLTLSDSITEIKNGVGYHAEGAFENCSELTDVNLSGNLAHIGTRAFANCSNLRIVNLAEGLTSIGNNAFVGCSKLESINLPNSITNIGGSAFSGCSSLTNIKIPENITEIASYTFSHCEGITSINIPDLVTRICSGAFNNCCNLTKIHLAENITSIDENAFSSCGELEEITIPSNVTQIGFGVFENCRKLKKVIISPKLTVIIKKAFSGCSELESVIIPNGVTDINDFAFENCVQLRNITIPDSVKSVKSSAFNGCKNLLFNGSPFLVIGTSLHAYTGCFSHVEIPQGVTEIQGGLIKDNWRLEKIDGVFGYHEEITSVTIPDSVKKIGSGTFTGCKNLEKITLSENVDTIGSYVFRDCTGLKQINIPDKITTIEENTFENCKEIRKVILPDSIIEIRGYAFTGCCNLEEINLPNMLSKIGYNAFAGCSNLQRINIPESLTELSGGTFEGCSNLKNVVIPENVRKIGSGAFKDCIQINDISIPDGITDLDLSIFDGCSNLKRITIPSSVKKINAKKNRWDGFQLDSIKQLVIDPNTKLETIEGPEHLLKFDYEISPFPMIPISLIEEPDTKVKYFFEYAENPEKYPANIAEEYEKYGRSQRSRILREAEAQNRPEVIAYYEKKGHKAKERTLTPEERSTLLAETIEKGTDDDLRKVLKKHKTFPNASEILGKTVRHGNMSKMQIMLDHGVDFSEGNRCFLDLLESETISEEKKYEMCSFIITNGKSDIIRNNILFAASILDMDNIIEKWNTVRNPKDFLKLDKIYDYKTFEKISDDQGLDAIRRIKNLTDPDEKPILRVDAIKNSGVFCPDAVNYILENFKAKSFYGVIIHKAVNCQQIESLKNIYEYLSNHPTETITDCSEIRESISQAVELKSIEIMKFIFDAGWGDYAKKARYPEDVLNWNSEVLMNAIDSNIPELLEILIANGIASDLPSSFSKINTLRAAVKADNPGALDILQKQGWIRTTANRDALIMQASDEGKNNALAWLLEYKNKTADPVKEEKAKEQKERKALDGDQVKLKDTASKKSVWKTNKLPDGTYGINRYSGDEDDKGPVLVIPAIAGKRIITAIMREAFSFDRYYGTQDRHALDSKKRIIISDGITTIKDMAFYGYDWLEAIAIPDSVTSIGNEVFEGSNPIIYGKSGSCAQRYAESSGIRFVNNDNSDKPIPDFAIQEDTLIKYTGKDAEPIIPKIIKQIGESAFEGCKSLTAITIPDGVTNIGKRSFSDCSNLISIKIPESVTSIGYGAFSGCSALTGITIPNSVTNIEDSSFYGCSALTSIKIPENVTNIGPDAFRGCSALTSFTMPDSVTIIRSGVFAGCYNLTQLVIPDTITSIAPNAFDGCTGLYDKDGKFLIVNSFLMDYKGKDSDVVIPDTVKTIIEQVFADHKEIDSVTIPDSVTRIGDKAFSNCKGLTKITIPQNLNYFGSNVFHNCTGLLKEEEKFLIINNSLELYKGNDSEVVIPDGVTSIQAEVFQNHDEIISITIPASVTEIKDTVGWNGKGAFENCKGLKNVTMAPGLTKIGQHAFKNCSSLTSLSIPEGVKEIGTSAFAGCTSIKNITIPSSVTSIGSFAFTDCKNIKKIVIPEGVTKIDWWTFENCKALTNITIPKSVIEFGSHVFEGCSESKLKLIVHEGSNALEYAKENDFKYEVI